MQDFNPETHSVALGLMGYCLIGGDPTLYANEDRARSKCPVSVRRDSWAREFGTLDNDIQDNFEE